jgi:hypothetical protein
MSISSIISAASHRVSNQEAEQVRVRGCERDLRRACPHTVYHYLNVCTAILTLMFSRRMRCSCAYKLFMRLQTYSQRMEWCPATRRSGWLIGFLAARLGGVETGCRAVPPEAVSTHRRRALTQRLQEGPFRLEGARRHPTAASGQGLPDSVQAPSEMSVAFNCK